MTATTFEPIAEGLGQPASRVRSLTDYVPGFLGVTLVLAAVLKAHQLAVEPGGTNIWLSIALIEVESALGLALLFRVAPQLTRWATIGLFACFLGASGLNVLTGAQSCSCFGKIEVKPWIALLFDALALWALCAWRPITTDRHAWPLLLLVIPTGCIAVVPLLAWLGVNPSFPQVVVASPRVDLGTLLQGERCAFEVQLRNPHSHHVVIMYVDSSCPCLQPLPTPCLLQPGQEVAVPLYLDLGNEPSFTGSMTIEVAGRTYADELVFRAKIVAQVNKNAPDREAKKTMPPAVKLTIS